MERRAIGIDIGGTAVKGGRLLAGGEIERSLERPSPSREAPAAMVALIAALARDLGGGEPLPLGIGCAGLVEPVEGRVRTSPNLPGWNRDFRLAAAVEMQLGRQPVVLNDANAFVLAESRLGAGRGARTVIGLTLGTGVGGGLVLADKLWTGHNGAAGEIGHMPLVADGPPCACGARGCLEAMVGTAAIIGRYRRAAGAAVAEGLDPREIAERALAGDEAALATYRETGRLLGLALAGLTHLLDPQLFVLGGGILRSADLLLPAARAALREGVMLAPDLVPPVHPATLGPDAGWIGAALAAMDAAEG